MSFKERSSLPVPKLIIVNFLFNCVFGFAFLDI
jgi:hypothetical protein